MSDARLSSAPPPAPGEGGVAVADASRAKARPARTLRRQLLAWLAVPLLVLWTVSSVLDYDIGKRFVNLAYDRALLEAALDIGRSIKRSDERTYLDLPDVALQMLQTRESDRLYYIVTNALGEYISGEPDFPPPPDLGPDRVSYYDDQYRGRLVRVVALRVPVEPGSGRGTVLIRVAERVTLRTGFARQLMVGMMLPQSLLIVLAALAVWYAVGRGLAPLATLRREIQSRSHRDLAALPEQQAPQELRPVISAMNDLLARLSAAISAQQRFIVDAAHQLRTPIAGLKTQTELALRQAQAADARSALQQLHTATEQTTRLINQLLSLARAEPEVGRASTTRPVDMGELAREATTEWVPRALARNIDLGFEGPPNGVRIAGDAFLLREMLNNLLDNAVRYTQPGGQVTVRVTAEPREIALSVEDNGPGVPDAERERVFERFYRVLGTGQEGCGLGLAIVKEIALRHGAQATLTAGAGGAGTVVRVAFPAAA